MAKKILIDESRIRELANAMGFGLSDLSTMTGHSESFVAQVLRRGWATKAAAISIANGLGCTVDDITLAAEPSKPTYEQIAMPVDEEGAEAIAAELANIGDLLVKKWVELQRINASLEHLTELYERAWIDKE